MAFEHSLDKVIAESGPRDKFAERSIKGLIDKDKLQFSDGEIIGLKDQLEDIKQNADYLFAKEGPTGKKPNIEGETPSSKYQKNPWSKEHWNLTEQGRLVRDQPELAKKLKSQAR